MAQKLDLNSQSRIAALIFFTGTITPRYFSFGFLISRGTTTVTQMRFLKKGSSFNEKLSDRLSLDMTTICERYLEGWGTTHILLYKTACKKLNSQIVRNLRNSNTVKIKLNKKLFILKTKSTA